MKTAFVTGSTRGIGRGIADLLLENGYTVIYSGTRDERPDDLPACADYIGCDISDSAARKKAVQHIVEKYGRLDVLVNNAGVAPLARKNVLETDEESFDRVLNINLKGTFFLCQLAANEMVEGKKILDDYAPRIINIGSISAYTASISRGEYCISKAGLAMVTMLFADALADMGVPVFEVRPGIIETDMTSAVHEKYETLIAGGLTPIKRFGKPVDVAQMVLVCCSGLLDFTSGQVLNADGGFHLRRL
jgi:Dehydrogenases with different specificities (related to short-chain alcohol dehydrogenases)